MEGSIELKGTGVLRGTLRWQTRGGLLDVQCFLWTGDHIQLRGSIAGFLTVGDQKISICLDRAEPYEMLAAAIRGVRAAGNVPVRTEITGPECTLAGGQTLEFCGVRAMAAEDVGPSEMTLSANTVQMGKKLHIYLDRGASNCVHKLTAKFGGQTLLLGENLESGFLWQVPDLAAECPDALSGNCQLSCATYRDGAYLGSTQAQLTLRVPEPTRPEPEVQQAVMGSPLTVRCPRASENFTTQLNLIWRGTTYPMGTGDLVSWTVSYELAKAIPNLVQAQGEIQCLTYNGTALVGDIRVRLPVVVPDNAITKPRIQAVTLEPIAEDPLLEGLYLRGKTGLRATIQAVSDYAAVADYSLRVGQQRAAGNPAVVELLSEAGQLRVVAAVTDSRGYCAQQESTISVLAYQRPRIIPAEGMDRVICQRADGQGNLSPQGTFLAIRAGCRFSGIPGPEGERNGCTLRYRWKRSREPNFGRWTTLGEGTVSQVISGVVTDPKTAYEVELSALDRLGGEHRMSFPIMTQAVNFALYNGTDGAAFGKYPELPHVVDVADHMTLLVRGKLEVRGEQWQNLGLSGQVRPAVQDYGRAEGCALRVSGGCQVFLAVSCALTWEDQPILLNRDPIPQELRPARTVCALCPCEGGTVRITVNPAGEIQAAEVTGNRNPGWVDGWLQYFL